MVSIAVALSVAAEAAGGSDVVGRGFMSLFDGWGGSDTPPVPPPEAPPEEGIEPPEKPAPPAPAPKPQ